MSGTGSGSGSPGTQHGRNEVVGPVYYGLLARGDKVELSPDDLVAAVLRAWRP